MLPDPGRPYTTIPCRLSKLKSYAYTGTLEAEVAEAETLFSSYQTSLRKRMIDVVVEKRKRVEEERALHLGQSIKSSSVRTLRKRGSKNTDAPETVTPLPGGGSTSLSLPLRISGSGGSFALQEQEILEDLYHMCDLLVYSFTHFMVLLARSADPLLL